MWFLSAPATISDADAENLETKIARGPFQASFGLKSNINNMNNNKNHNNDNYYSTTDNDYYKKERRHKHYTTTLKQKRTHTHAHGLRVQNFWKRHDFAPMQFTSFD